MSENQNNNGENCSPSLNDGAQAEAEKLTQQLAKMFAALAHPARSRIVLELGKGELCVNDLAEMLKISHSSVSQHLAILRSQALIKEQKAGRFVFYRLINPKVASWLNQGGPFADIEAASLDDGRQPQAAREQSSARTASSSVISKPGQSAQAVSMQHAR